MLTNQTVKRFSFVFFRQLCFVEVAPIHQNQKRQPGNTAGLDTTGSTGKYCAHSLLKSVVLTLSRTGSGERQLSHLNSGRGVFFFPHEKESENLPALLCVPGGAFAEENDDAEVRELAHWAAQLLSMPH